MEAREFRQHLTETIIPFWNALKDDENGGFYGYADGKAVPEPKADKGVILNSRILWFYSSAYTLLKEETLLSMATHAYRFLRDYCLDRENGGVYWSMHYDGSVSDSTKHTYNQAFAIYALSAYYEASGDEEAKELAYGLYHLVEETCCDDNGYLEAFDRYFQPAENDKLSENGVMATRTMNTLLHVLEAYSKLYEVAPREDVKTALVFILKRFKEIIYNPNRKICEVFFDEDYHTLIDLESYGHDIESSWLIDRACEVLKDDAIQEEMKEIIDGLAEGALLHAMDTVNGGMNNECEKGVVDTKKVWWVQAEAVVGFYNEYMRNPGDTRYEKTAEEIWSFIQNYVVDKTYGEWIENIYDIHQIDDSQALAHPWKCPYHNGRMCMEMVKRLS